MVAIFVVDLNAPLGLAVPFFYLLLALLAIGLEVHRFTLLAIALLGPMLAGIKLLIHPSDGVVWLGQMSRLIFSLLIKDAAAKYKDDKAAPAALAAKIKGGGKAAWGASRCPRTTSPRTKPSVWRPGYCP